MQHHHGHLASRRSKHITSQWNLKISEDRHASALNPAKGENWAPQMVVKKKEQTYKIINKKKT